MEATTSGFSTRGAAQRMCPGTGHVPWALLGCRFSWSLHAEDNLTDMVGSQPEAGNGDFLLLVCFPKALSFSLLPSILFCSKILTKLLSFFPDISPSFCALMWSSATLERDGKVVNALVKCHVHSR